MKDGRLLFGALSEIAAANIIDSRNDIGLAELKPEDREVLREAIQLDIDAEALRVSTIRFVHREREHLLITAGFAEAEDNLRAAYAVRDGKLIFRYEG